MNDECNVRAAAARLQAGTGAGAEVTFTFTDVNTQDAADVAMACATAEAQQDSTSLDPHVQAAVVSVVSATGEEAAAAEANHMIRAAISGAARLKQADAIASLGETCTRLEERLRRAEKKKDRQAQDFLVARAFEESSEDEEEMQLLVEIESCLMERITEASRGGGKPRRRVCSPTMASFLSIILSREYSLPERTTKPCAPPLTWNSLACLCAPPFPPDGGAKVTRYISQVLGGASVETVKNWRQQTPKLVLGTCPEAIHHNLANVVVPLIKQYGLGKVLFLLGEDGTAAQKRIDIVRPRLAYFMLLRLTCSHAWPRSERRMSPARCMTLPTD